MKEKVLLTNEGKEKLVKELKNLVENVRPVVIEELTAARAQGDLSENADYDAARERQAQVESRISEIENMLSNFTLITASKEVEKSIRLGSVVSIKDLSTNEVYKWTIVGSVEASPLDNKISNESEVAKAILGKKLGDVVTVKVKKSYEIKVLDIEKY